MPRSDALPMPTMDWLRERAIVTDADCWEWQGARKNGQYGKFGRGHKFFQVHRHAWALVNGPIPDGMFVCHRCDNPPCFNPEHLFLGTAGDNNRDTWSKGRGVNNPRGGERHHNTHLTAEDVLAIRQIRAESGLEHREIGARFGISANAACKIARRQTWKEVA